MWVNPKGYKTVGESLAAARKEKGMTQRELADRLMKPQSFVSAFEAGQRRIDILEFLRIAAAIGADPVALFTGIAAACGSDQPAQTP